jgi:type VI secretion system (T6SS) immunity protein Tdi1
VDAIRTFSARQYADALSSWTWLDVVGKAALCTSPFGDVFLEDGDGVWWLDTVEGTLTRPWADRAEFAAAMSTADGQNDYLMAGLALAAEANGLVPGPDQIYDFRVHPQLGGALEPENVEVTDFVVALAITGQVLNQIRDLPPGTKISGVTVEEEPGRP